VAWGAAAEGGAKEGAARGAADAAKPAGEGTNAPAQAQPQPFGPQVADPAAAAAAEAARQEREAREAHEAAEARERADLRAGIETLRRELDAERAARAATESSLTAQLADLNAQAAATPPTVSTPRLGVGLTGFVQADLQIRQSSQDQLNSSAAPLNTNTFFIRRARLRAFVDRWWVAGLVELDGNTVNGAQARLIGAEASLKWPPERGNPLPLAMATIGLFKIPFGFEVGQSDRERLFLERSTTERALFPGEYDLGARLMGGWRFLRYALAVQDGEPIGERTFPLRDPNAAKDITWRFGVDTSGSTSVWAAGGVSGLTGKGFHPGTAATKPTVQWRDLDGNGVASPNEIMVIPGAAATPSQNFSRFCFGADLRIGVNVPTLGQTVLYGELYEAKNLDRALVPADPVSFGRDYREEGFYVGLTQDLGAHAQAGARFDFYNPDKDSTNQVMGATLPTAMSYWTLALAAALRGPSGRLIGEFDLNRNHLGRDSLGNPTNMKDNAFFIRGEVSF
jgi:hypothetical protein